MVSAWAEFSREVLGEPYLVWHDGADFGPLLARWRDQPEMAGEMLRLGIGEGDPIAAQAVSYLARGGAAASELGAPLRDALPGARGTFLVRVAEALFALTADQGLAAPICGVLTGDAHWAEKIDAAIALSAFAPAGAVVRALALGVRDPEYLVRRHSAQALLTLARRPTTIENEPGIWEMIRGDRSRAWRAAGAELTRPWPQYDLL